MQALPRTCNVIHGCNILNRARLVLFSKSNCSVAWNLAQCDQVTINAQLQKAELYFLTRHFPPGREGSPAQAMPLLALAGWSSGHPWLLAVGRSWHVMVPRSRTSWFAKQPFGSMPAVNGRHRAWATITLCLALHAQKKKSSVLGAPPLQSSTEDAGLAGPLTTRLHTCICTALFFRSARLVRG